MRRKSFTLLELIIVIVIVGILATLGLTQYGRMVERSRGAEARSILGDLRKLARAYHLENGALNAPAPGIAAVNLNLGQGAGQIPTAACLASHYFRYTFAGVGADQITFTATRCAAGTGKTPGAPAPTGGQTLTLQSNVAMGVDLWGGTGPWR